MLICCFIRLGQITKILDQLIQKYRKPFVLTPGTEMCVSFLCVIKLQLDSAISTGVNTLKIL